jgi:hypothetical protein
MRKALHTFCIILLIVPFASAQPSAGSVPNGNFETWVTKSYHLPTAYLTSSNKESIRTGDSTVYATNDAYHGAYAVKVTTITTSNKDTVSGWFSTATATTEGDPTSWKGGIPYTGMPTGFRGYYKYNVAQNDSALVGVVFKKGGSTYAHYFYAVGGIHSSYTLFDFTFHPALTQAPDSIIFIATSSNELRNIRLPGSVLKIDSVSFTGVANQPADLNGDFENWSRFTTDPLPKFWDVSDSQQRTIQSADAEEGSYALELQTVTENNNGTLKASNSWANIHLYTQAGFPCPTSDSLIFYYKYIPAVSSDVATVNINLRHNNTFTGGGYMELHQSNVYQRKALYFAAMDNLQPDTIDIYINSSVYTNTDPSYAGARLYIDGINFKSQLSTGVSSITDNSKISVYPLPVTGVSSFNIASDVDISDMTLFIYDAVGKTAATIPVTNHKVLLYKKDFPPGIYFYNVKKAGASVKNGKFTVR